MDIKQGVVILTVVLATVLSVHAKQLRRTQRSVCTGVVNGTFIPDDDSCSSFFVCYNEEPVSQSCSPGSYFDQTNLYCLPDTNNTCPQPQCSVDGAFSAHPSDCNLFYVCYQGQLVEQSCGPKSYFDQSFLYCLPDKNNTCPQPECNVDGAFSPHETNCNSFYVCYQGELVEQSCGEGSYFDKTNLYCLPDTDNSCPVAQCSDDGVFSPHPTNCNLFYVCSDGQLVEQSCGAGSYFDKTNLYCLPDENNTCAVPQCTVEGAFSPHPTQCALFYVCYDGLLVEQTCGNGSYFDKINLYCLPDTDEICWSSTPPSTAEPCTCVGGYTEGEFVASPDSCYSYYICNEGELVEQNCGYGNYFDNSTKRCERDTFNRCWPVNTTSTSTTTAPCKCPGGYEEGELVASSQNCSLYYVCTQAELIERTCGYGNHFNNNTKTCERDDKGDCWPTEPPKCQCPGGLEEGDLVGNSDSCHSYFICTQGELIAESCETDNYFDSSSNTCVRDTDGICWNKTTTPTPCSCPGGYKEGDLIGNSDSCYSYFVCTQGELIAESCGTDNYFDSSSNTCVRDTDGICWNKTTTPTPCSCPGGYEEGDLIGNSDSCYSYFVCTQGELVAESCGSGNYFDSTTKTCVRDSNGICWNTTTTPAPCTCPGSYEEGDLVENNDSCYSYFVCTQGELVARTCGTGNLFDSESKSCIIDTTGACWPISVPPSSPTTPKPTSSPTLTSTTKPTTEAATTTNPCTCPGGYEDGEFIPYPGNCSMLYICVNGELEQESCGYGNYFDAELKTCVVDINETCWKLPTSPSTPTTPKLTPSPTTPSPTTQTTPKSTTSSTTQKATPSTTSTTAIPESCTCPGGYEDGEFIPYPGNCSMFYICVSGELNERSCGYGNYFDVESKSCVWDTTGSCWALTTSPSTPTTPKLTPSPTTPSTTTAKSTATPTTPKTTPSSTTPLPTTPSPTTAKSTASPTTPKTTASPTPTTTTQPTTETPCTCPGGYNDGEFISYPGNCSMFYICVSGELNERSCGYGNYFDDESKSCVLDTTGICWALATSPSTPTTPKLTPSPTTPKATPSPTTPSTTTAKSTATPTTPKTTPSSTTPLPITPSPTTAKSTASPTTPKTTASLTPTPTTQPTTETPCTCPGGYNDGEFISYPGNCSMFYICVSGELNERSCGYGNYFDDESKSCVLDTTGICWALATSPSTPTTPKVTPSPTTPKATPSPTTPSTTTAKSTATPTTPKTTPSSTTPLPITPSPTTAKSTASPTTPKTTASPTPTPTTQPTTETPCTCPGGYNDGEFISYPGNCSMFYICVSGELNERSCGYGNYFDDESKSCVLDTTGICWTIATSPSTPTTPKVTPSPTTPKATPSPTTPSPTTLSTTTAKSTATPTTLKTTPSPTTPLITTPSTTTVKSTASPTTPKTTASPTPTPTTQPTTETPCTCPGGYNDGEFISYPGNCSMFYICVSGELNERSCGYGNYFDDESKTCVWDTTGICWTLPTSPSTPTTTKLTPSPATTKVTPSPTTPSTTTAKSTATPTTLKTTPPPTTPLPTTPSPTTAKPTASPTTPKTTASPTPTTTTQPTTETPCTCPGGYNEGDFISYPGNCSMFYICVSGELNERSCGYGNYFDDESKSCVWDTTGICWTLPTSPSTPTTTKLTPSPATTKVTPSPTTPSTTTAKSTATPTTLKTTPSPTTPLITTPSPTTAKSTASPTTTKTTASPTPIPTTQPTTETPCTCPGGYNEGDFISYPGNCSMFYICVSGELNERSCGYGNYFDDESKSCVWDTTGICWTLPTSPSTPTTTELTPSPTTTKVTPSTTTPSTTTAKSTATPTTTKVTASPTTLSTTTAKSTATPTTPKATPSPTTPLPTTLSPTTAKSTASPTTPKTTASPTPTPTTQPTTETPCTCPGGYNDGEFIPYPGNCSMFYICFRGELNERSCGYGNYFDDQSKSCVWDTTGICWTLPTSPSTPTTTKVTPSPTTPKATPSPTTLSPTTPSTTTAKSTATPTTLKTTPSPTTPLPTTPSPTTAKSTASPTTPKTTASPTPTPTTQPTTDTPCTCPGGYNEGDFISYPGNCSMFYICVSGELNERSCGYGNYFDDESKSCVWDTTGICWTLPTSPSTPTTPKVTPSPTTPKATPSPTTPLPTTPSPTTAKSTASPTTPKSTPSPTTPSPTTPSPTTPSPTTPSPTTPSPTLAPSTQPTSAAPCTCPGGYQENEFIPHPSSCYLFYVCYQSELVEVSCGFGNYFDNQTKSCVLDTENKCWGQSSSSTTTVATTSSTTTASCTCPGGYENGDFIPHPDSCYLFYVCYQSELSELSCGVGNLFDNTTKSCVYDTEEICWTNSTTPAPTPCECSNGLKEGQLALNPSSCSSYYLCYGGELVEGNCGTGNYFNNDTNRCEPDSGGYCWPVKPTTPCECPNGLNEGQLTTNPSACYLYSVCYGGELVEGHCGSGNYFNNVSNACEPDTGGCCWPVKPTPPTPCDCSNGLKQGQFTANPSACYLYYVCYGGELVEGHCGTGNYFNNSTNSCQPDTGGCCWSVNPAPSPPPPQPTPCECPNELKEGELTSNPSACYLYNLCHSGALVEGNCGTGNYFNNVSKHCEPDLGGCCWPVNPTPSPPPPEPTPCECPNGAKEGQFTAHPSSCYLFHICHGGELVQQNCGFGNYFNNATSICEPDLGGCCWPKPTTCLGGYKTGEFIANPGECDKFFICNDGILIEQECGVGYLFDMDNNYCTRDIDGTCWAAEHSENTCVDAPDGTFLANEAACDKFFVCYNNIKFPQECGIGNLFNKATLTCTRDTYGTCWKKIPNVCANTITGTFVPNPYNCQEFYVCHKNRATLQQCSSGQWFNPTLMICQPDMEAECVNPCQGTNTTRNLAHPNCNQFYRCARSLTVGVETCPKGTNFDATDGICKTSAICEADLCYQSTNGAVHAVQNDVTSFYTCYNKMPVKRNCPDGTSFDSELLICTPDTGRCIGQRDGYLVQSYSNPNAFYVCRNNMAIFQQCPSYAIFDEKKKLCVQAERKRLVNNICSAEPNGTMLSAGACNKFHLCLDGEHIEQNCGAYSSFNQKISQCVFNLSCYDQNEICVKSSDIEKFPDARYETSFIKCKRGFAIVEKCPKNMIYSHDIGHCVPRELAMTQDELDELCDDVPVNTLSPALDCRKFYICHNRVAMLQQCAVDQHFDRITGTCQPDVGRQCWLRSETLRRSFHLKTVCHEGQIRDYPTNCEQFEICTYGLWTKESCPTGQYFDSHTKVCIVGNKDRKCPTARSVIECFDDMPLRASENLCTDYYRCVNNLWKIQKCPVGEFFNNKIATCTKDPSACIRKSKMRSIKESHCSFNETRASDVNCGIFHVCYKGEWWYRHCDEGAYFNKSLEACVPNDGTCLLISKGGPCKNGTAKKSDFDPCTAYYLCTDGNWTIQHCPTGHHFNESHKACMLDYEDRACRAELGNVSSTCVEGYRRYKSSNCTAFEVCSFGKWLSVACRSDFYYDTTLDMCIVNRGECSEDGLLRLECVDNTFRPNENNCSEFYYCSRNEWHQESCLERFQYNATIDKCVPANSTCAMRNQTNWIPDKCTGVRSGSYVSHEGDCTKYYLCIDYEAVEATCGYGKFFDKESRLCQLNDGSCPLKTQADNTICESKPNGNQVPNPANCTTFYICNDKQPLLSYCSPGMYFNVDLGVCQTDTGICNKPRLCDNNTGGHLPHETYCNIYYSCVRGVAIPVACEEDQIFDSLSKKCITDVEHRCIDGILIKDEICAKAENGERLVDSDDCTKYIVCTNGLSQKIQCPQGQFFDSSLMFCMSDDGSCPYVDGSDLPNNSGIPPDPITCIGKHGDLMPDPEHCNEFYLCIYGSLRHDRCFDGEFFDIKTYSCRKMLADDKCSTVAEMSTLCATSEDGTNFADQTDCRKYYQCNEAELQSKKCRTGESFDTLLGFCRQNDGTCLLENGQRVGACAGKHGKLTANAENCRGYFTCVNGQKISDECENGEYFDKLASVCQKDVNNTCRPVEDEFTNATQLSCVNLTELVFYPNILDGCKTFFQCVKGTARVHKCPDDLLFNGESGICDWKDYVKCIDMTEHYQNDETCLNVNNGTRYGNTEDNCDSYFICTDGKSKNFKCDQGLKYNAKVEKCDLAANVNCTMIKENSKRLDTFNY